MHRHSTILGGLRVVSLSKDSIFSAPAPTQGGASVCSPGRSCPVRGRRAPFERSCLLTYSPNSTCPSCNHTSEESKVGLSVKGVTNAFFRSEFLVFRLTFAHILQVKVKKKNHWEKSEIINSGWGFDCIPTDSINSKWGEALRQHTLNAQVRG